jgi:protein tyrosine phosphatase
MKNIKLKVTLIILSILSALALLIGLFMENQNKIIAEKAFEFKDNTCDSLKVEIKRLSDYIELLEKDNQIMSSLLAEKENNVKVKKMNFKLVPGNKNIYRSPQPTLKQLEKFLKISGVKTVIRMNDTEGTGVSIEKERELVESLGLNFIWVNAHLGYKKGQGYTESIDLAYPIIENGNVLIHCTAGKDRTGYMVGYYLLKSLGWSKNEVWDYTIEHNDWEKFISEGRNGYIKYMEAFYPYDEWVRNYK